MEFHTLLSPRFYPLFFHYLRSEMGLMGCYAFTPPLIFQGWTTRGGGKTAWNSIDHVVHFYQHFVYFFICLLQSNINHRDSREQKSGEKNPKSCTLLKRPKITFLGEWKIYKKSTFLPSLRDLYIPPRGVGGVSGEYVDFWPRSQLFM